MSSFRFTQTFESHLSEVCEKLNKTKTALIVDAVYAYASGVIPDKAVTTALKKLSDEQASLRQDLDGIRTLCLQILKNQQGNFPNPP